MGVSPYRMQVSSGSLRVSQILLRDQDKRPLRHPPLVDLLLSNDDLLKRSCNVDGPCVATGVSGPRDTLFDRKVHLECRRTVTKTLVRTLHARRKAITCKLYGCGGSEIKNYRISAREFGQRPNVHAGVDTATLLPEDRGQGVGDRLGATVSDRPSQGVTCGR